MQAFFQGFINILKITHECLKVILYFIGDMWLYYIYYMNNCYCKIIQSYGLYSMTWKYSDWKYKYQSLYRVIYSLMWKSPEWINFPRFVLNYISCFKLYIGLPSILKCRCRNCNRIITRKCHLLVARFLLCYSNKTLFLSLMAMYYEKYSSCKRPKMKYN